MTKQSLIIAAAAALLLCGVVYTVRVMSVRQVAATSEREATMTELFRREALQHRVTYSTTVAGARALVHSLD